MVTATGRKIPGQELLMKIAMFRSSLKDGFKEQSRRIEERCVGLSADQLSFRPDEKSWSVGQCLYHIWLTNDKYLSKLSSTIRASTKKEPDDQDYESNWMGRRFIGMIGPTSGEHTPVPKQLQPLPERVPEDIVQRSIDQMAGFDEFLIESEGIDLMKTKMTSPISSMLKLQLGDVFKSMQLHNERHLNQIDKILRLSGISAGLKAGSVSDSS